MERETSQHLPAFYFWSKVVVIFLLLAGGWHYLFANRAIVELAVTTNTKSSFKIYYPNANNHWAERTMSQVIIRPDIQKYSFRLKDLRKIDKLRIDPTEKEGEVTIHSLLLRQYGYKPINLLHFAKEGKLEYETETTAISLTDTGIKVTAKSNDPKIFVSIPKLQSSAGKEWAIFRLLLFFAIAILLVKLSRKILPKYRFILFAMLIITALTAVMAGISVYNTHPDERVHCDAAKFYIDNTLPPAVGDPRAEGTYSPYGYSRLYSGELAYIVAGKFAKLVEPLDLPNYLAFRYANVALLTILLFCACYNLTWRILLVPIFLFPQIWYIFSYWNSDALALFLSLCACWQLADKKSAWNRLACGEVSPRSIIGGLWLVLLLAALFFCKKNFYAFLLFAGLFVLHSLLYKKITMTRGLIATTLAIIFCAGSLVGGYHFQDARQNDFAKSERIKEQAIIHADKGFSPDAPLEKLRPHLHMKQRGTTFDEMLATRWGERSFRSSVGEYGYTSVPGSFNYYHYMRYGLVFFGVAVVFFTLARGGSANITLMLITTATAFLLIAASFNHSWTMDYQAQGRYLLPITAMFSLFYFSARKPLENIVILSLGTLVFCGGIYSFIFVALAGIGKIAAPF